MIQQGVGLCGCGRGPHGITPTTGAALRTEGFYSSFLCLSVVTLVRIINSSEPAQRNSFVEKEDLVRLF